VTALEEQLGLRLERVRAPREFIVIDQVQRPTPGGDRMGIEAGRMSVAGNGLVAGRAACPREVSATRPRTISDGSHSTGSRSAHVTATRAPRPLGAGKGVGNNYCDGIISWPPGRTPPDHDQVVRLPPITREIGIPTSRSAAGLGPPFDAHARATGADFRPSTPEDNAPSIQPHSAASLGNERCRWPSSTAVNNGASTRFATRHWQQPAPAQGLQLRRRICTLPLGCESVRADGSGSASRRAPHAGIGVGVRSGAVAARPITLSLGYGAHRRERDPQSHGCRRPWSARVTSADTRRHPVRPIDPATGRFRR
jgi:hypothetical protein